MRAFLLGITGLALAGALACGGGPAAGPAGGEATADAGGDPRQMFVGTWKLVRFERYDADGQLLPPPESGAFGAGAPLGYIMYDGEHMGVIIQQENRKPFAGAQPTADEAAAALSSYVSYFGPYTVNEAEGYVTHHVLGSNSPAMTGADNQRFYEFSGNELALRPAGNAAITAFETYGSYAGPFIPHPQDGYLLHRRTAALSPGSAGVDAQRFYEFRDDGNVLVRMPVPREVDGNPVQRYIHWERLSNLDAG